MSIQSELTKVATNGVERLVKGVQPAIREAGDSVAGTLGREVLLLTADAGRVAERSAEREAVEAGTRKFGLIFDDATKEWLATRRAGKLLEVLDGFKLDAPGFRALTESVNDRPVEVSRVKAIAQFVRERPWMNPDLKTIEGFRAALPTGRNPAAAELEAAVHKADFRFNREYELAPDWIDDAHTWEFLGHNGQAGDEGASYWLRNPGDKHTYLAKLPPDPRRGVNERVGYGIHTALGVPANQVQYGQRDWQPLLTFHRIIAGDTAGLDRAAEEIGIRAAEVDFRVGAWPYPTENIGTGPSTWNRANAKEYLAKIGPQLEDPAAFDKMAFVGRINDDGDMKPGNILATIVGQNAEGLPVWKITRIDFGIMHDGYKLRNLPEDLGIFQKYLDSLETPTNSTHLDNILSTMKQFASMSDENLTSDILGRVTRNADDSAALHMPPEYQYQMSRRFLVKRDMVRAWLEKHQDLIAKVGG